MSIVTIAQIALDIVLIVMLAWRLSKQRSKFTTKDSYTAWVAGIFVMLAGVALLEAHLRLGYSWPPSVVPGLG